VVWTLGGQLHLRNVVRRVCAGRAACGCVDDRARRRMAACRAKFRWRMGRNVLFLQRCVFCRPRAKHPFPDRVGRFGAPTGRARRPACLPPRPWFPAGQAEQRDVGRAGVHGHRVSARYLHQLSFVQAPLPHAGARRRQRPAGRRSAAPFSSRSHAGERLVSDE